MVAILFLGNETKHTMNMKNTIYIFSLLIFCGIGFAYSQPSLENPESIIPYNGNFLVSNIGKKLDAELDKDGFIALVDSNGIIITENYFNDAKVKLNAPKGMAIIGQTLYVTDIQRIVGYDLNRVKDAIVIDLASSTKFLNDIVAQDENTVLVTDTFENAVFTINLTSKTIEKTYNNLEGVNGIANSKDGLFIVTTGLNLNATGNLKHIDFKGNIETLKSGSVGILDGVQQVSNKNILITDWKDLEGGEGYIYLYDTLSETLETSTIKITSPADFYFDEKSGKVFIPQTLYNRILVYSITELFPNYKRSNLFHYGFIDSFLGGMYDGGYTYKNLLNQGGFGLGAPDKLDGEITILDGIAYQTRASGNTVIPENSEKISYAFVTNFSKDFDFRLKAINSKEKLEQKLDEQLRNINGMYAIKIEGKFKKLKSRAFPPVKTKPYPELASMLENQSFFNFENVEGILIGFRLPQFLSGVNVPGYHFHFISKDKSKGGHLIEVEIDDANIEIDALKSYSVEIPISEEFEKFNFDKDRSADVKKAESGKKD